MINITNSKLEDEQITSTSSLKTKEEQNTLIILNKSILSFNKSITNREDFLTNKSPYQIFPSHSFINDNFINTFKQLNISFNNNILIHTAFIIRPFSSNTYKDEYTLDNIKYNILQYVKLANILKTRYILIHGPMNEDEYNNFDKGLNLIYEILKNRNIIVCIEISAFSSSLIKLIKNNDYYNFCKDYLNKIIDFTKNDLKFQITIDTAHLHTNGLNYKEMIKLLTEFKDNYDFIHLNGNIKPQLKYPDEHIHINSIDDKINHSRRLLIFISQLKKICICENSNNKNLEENRDNYNYWMNIAKDYNYDLVEYNKNYSY